MCDSHDRKMGVICYHNHTCSSQSTLNLELVELEAARAAAASRLEQ